jgi:ABC-type branched-subunit amino acid transport system substrate-binding protein
MSSVIAKITDAGADVLVIHGVDQPMALLMKQSRAAGLDIPIVDSSSIVEPTATALFEPAELKNTCAETPLRPKPGQRPRSPRGPTPTRSSSTKSPTAWR